jgi:uncharacterized protein (DUF2147 family)
MRQVWFLAVLMVLSPSAHAGSFSFSIGGHRIHVESSRYCRSTSCASVSISGIYSSRRNRDRYDDDPDTVDPVQTPPAPIQPVPPQAAPVIAAVPAKNPLVQPTVVAPPPAVFKPAATVTQIVAAPPPPPLPRPVQQATIMPPPPSPVAAPAEAVRPAPVPAVAPEISRVSLQEREEEPADTPVGDWQTEGKGSVRIVKCGQALCGYVLNTSSDDKGEAVLINMKPKTDTQWTGSVYSHDSGDTYYGTMDIKGPDRLRVEACALGRFYCSGNNWTRIVARDRPLMSSRQTLPEPRS